MNTPAHLILAATLFARPGAGRRNAAVLAGATIPDISIMVMIAWQHWAVGHPLRQVFEHDYRSAFWQGVFAVDNSIPIWGALLGLALLTGRKAVALAAGAALVHLATDLPLHNEDARRHFWPLTDWMYRSPLSYWDPRHHGREVRMAEAAVMLALCWRLAMRFQSAKARALIALAALAEAIPTLIVPVAAAVF
ncbi:MAG: hypothetical protein ACJA1L_003471 [Paracoccaceae bacterium]